MPDRSNSFGTTDVLLLLMATIWGVNYSVVKYAGHAFGDLAFTWMRVLFATIVLLVAVLLQRKALPRRSDVLRLLALGVVCWSVYTVGGQSLAHRVDAVQLSALTIVGGIIPLAFASPQAISSILSE